MRRTTRARLFTVYVLATLVPVALLMVLGGRAIADDTNERALTEAVSRADTIADSGIEPALDGHELTSGITAEERAALVRATARLHGAASALRVRLHATDGTIVFDADHPDDPPVPDDDDEVHEAAAGEPQRLLTRVGADEVDGGGDAGVRAVETYVPIHRSSDGATVGVLETYLPYAPFEQAAHDSQRRLTALLAVGLLGLWAVLAVVTLSVTGRLRRSADANDWLAHHDPLTGLPNRTAFAEIVAERWDTGTPVLVAMADIDRFREVNDTLGQANGDRFLVTLAEMLRDRLGPDVTVARVGGDQYGILVAAPAPDAEDDLLRHIATVATAPFVVGGVTVRAELTVGMASSADPVGDAAGLLRAAELALHEAKEVHLGALRYSPELDHFDPARLALAAELGTAITDGQLELHYQPKVDLATREVRSVEALVRWRHPERGLLPPVEFIPIAESTSLIEPLTAWVVAEAARLLTRWSSTHPDLGVSVNLSARSLADPALPDRLLTALADAGVAPTRLQVEITETAMLADPAHASFLLQRLHNAGVGVSLDDFGQGATSLASLAGLPLDEIKIDRAFVVAMEDGDEARAVVEFVVALGHRLGLTVVAEGIETDASARELAALGCDEGQGYLFSRPVPADQLEDWLVRHDQLRSHDLGATADAAGATSDSTTTTPG